MRITNRLAGAWGRRVTSKALYGGCRYSTGIITHSKFTRLSSLSLSYPDGIWTAAGYRLQWRFSTISARRRVQARQAW